MPSQTGPRTRGADLIARTLVAAGGNTVFTLSGNHIMSVFDAAFDVNLDLVHTRHEAACVHMADAFARLTGEVGIALVTGGQGHTNAVAALTTAQGSDSPIVLLSGHAGAGELGRGGFQELDQAGLAAPVTKASWMVSRADQLGHDLAKAMRIAQSGRPGPVHLSLPSDLLDATITDSSSAIPSGADFARSVQPLSSSVAGDIVAMLASAKRPLILAGPMLATPSGRVFCAETAAALGVPVLPMESPRGVLDPSLGTFAEILAEADLILLLGKPHDFTIKFGAAPFVRSDARFIVIDPEPRLVERARNEQRDRLILTAIADADAAARALALTTKSPVGDTGWFDHVAQAVAYRPAAWSNATGPDGRLHPVELCRPIRALIEREPDSVLIVDGGEIGQWGQACLPAHRRVINGVAGSIGGAVPFALGARVVERDAPVIAVMGDGTFGFHMAEIDTAVRHDLPVVLVIGNDARWNAEHQIQLRNYGQSRVHGCSLLPSRYDQVAIALGGHGECVTSAAEMAPALERALASRKPAVINVMIEGHAAPQIRRPA